MTQEHIGQANSVESRCEGKVRFETQALAAKVANRKTRRRHGGMAPYHCTCGGWHLATPRRAPVAPPTSWRKTGGYRG